MTDVICPQCGGSMVQAGAVGRPQCPRCCALGRPRGGSAASGQKGGLVSGGSARAAGLPAEPGMPAPPLVGAPATGASVSLARANLLRIRGQWAEAADVCVEVLRADPANATAHSLLGDIYQDQGRPEEARHWYQLALELHPESVADRAKLDRVQETLEARNQRAEWEAVIEGRSQPVATSVLVRESLQRMGALAGAAVCGIVLVMATLVSLSSPGRPHAGEEAAGLFAGRFQRGGPVLDTPAEQALFRRLRDQEGVGSSQLVRLELDMRDATAHLRILLPSSLRDRYKTAEYRRVALREGYRWAYTLFRVEPNVKRADLFLVGAAVPGGAVSDVVTATLTPPLAANLQDGELERTYQHAGPVAWGAEFKPTPGEPPFAAL